MWCTKVSSSPPLESSHTQVHTFCIFSSGHHHNFRLYYGLFNASCGIPCMHVFVRVSHANQVSVYLLHYKPWKKFTDRQHKLVRYVSKLYLMLFNKMTYMAFCTLSLDMVILYISPKTYIISSWLGQVAYTASYFRSKIHRNDFPPQRIFHYFPSTMALCLLSFHSPLFSFPTLGSIQTRNICKTEQEKNNMYTYFYTYT